MPATFFIKSESVSKKTEQLIRSSLALSDIEYPESQNNNVGMHIIDTGTSKNIIKHETMARNEAEPHDPVPTVTDGEMSRIDLIDVEKTACSPAKKKTKIDTESIIMGEQLTDLEISFAQQLLKEQFHHINGLQSTCLILCTSFMDSMMIYETPLLNEHHCHKAGFQKNKHRLHWYL